jgi:hypothetical protein
MNINFIVDYNTNLFYLVNFLSKWNLDVNMDYYEYFKDIYDFTETDQQLLENYANIRRNEKIGWDQEANLMKWAMDGFPDHEIFNPLKPLVLHFESMVFKDGTKLHDFISKKLIGLESGKEKLENEYKKLEAEILIEKLSLLNLQYRQMKDVRCYLIFSVNDDGRGQAGANGGEIVCEYSVNDDDLKSTASVLVHEYMHIAICIKNRLVEDEDTKEFFTKEYLEFPTRTYADMFEELFVYSACNALIDHVDSKRKVEKYSKFTEQVYREAAFWWTHIDEFGDVISQYMEGKLDSEKTYELLIKKFKSYVSMTDKDQKE